MNFHTPEPAVQNVTEKSVSWAAIRTQRSASISNDDSDCKSDHCNANLHTFHAAVINIKQMMKTVFKRQVRRLNCISRLSTPLPVLTWVTTALERVSVDGSLGPAFQATKRALSWRTVVPCVQLRRCVTQELWQGFQNRPKMRGTTTCTSENEHSWINWYNLNDGASIYIQARIRWEWHS